jgi:hypothetical protein
MKRNSLSVSLTLRQRQIETESDREIEREREERDGESHNISSSTLNLWVFLTSATTLTSTCGGEVNIALSVRCIRTVYALVILISTSTLIIEFVCHNDNIAKRIEVSRTPPLAAAKGWGRGGVAQKHTPCQMLFEK